ncbi:acyl-CoA synthetase [Colwellia sp. BRX10-3]|uniref:acyl-CoA synthetase n=1 Tax=Colwellia sp. BRX10-3 TaxID=2759844 RepID=UPI0015F6B49C|nr:acyl-CoA synthetase [Colwellia sp. BRX10-3]MBA6390094.1 acyl-CoA synthetase [Colwellia sp. BRX10-3]
MPNLNNHSVEQAQLSWLQSNSGEWSYFVDDNLADSDAFSVPEQDYIWLVSQATATHKVSGYRITHQTIENYIEQLAGTEQAIVFGVPDENKGNAIHAYVELSSTNIELSTFSKVINAKLAGCLGEFARTDVITFVDEFPVAKNKEISRKILKSQNIKINMLNNNNELVNCS